jgi:hypothetical protein
MLSLDGYLAQELIPGSRPAGPFLDDPESSTVNVRLLGVDETGLKESFLLRRMLESRESILEGEATHLLLELSERFARQQRPENVLVGFEAVAGGSIEIVQVTDHFRYHLLGSLGVKCGGRNRAHGCGLGLGQGGTEAADEVIQGRLELL